MATPTNVTFKVVNNRLVACLPDGSEIGGVRSITISGEGNAVTAAITTTQATIEDLQLPATVKDGTLIAACSAIRSALSMIDQQCKQHAENRHARHVHGPAAIKARYLLRELTALEKTLEQAPPVTPTPQPQPEPPPIVHFAPTPGGAICGSDVPDQALTDRLSHVTCPKCSPSPQKPAETPSIASTPPK